MTISESKLTREDVFPYDVFSEMIFSLPASDYETDLESFLFSLSTENIIWENHQQSTEDLQSSAVSLALSSIP
jgi:hypothetical protein